MKSLAKRIPKNPGYLSLNLGAADPPAKSLTVCWLKINMKGIQKS